MLNIHLSSISSIFFFNDTATTEIYTLSLHDALPISPARQWASTALAWRRSRGSIVSTPKRCTKAPSMPYSCIQRKWRSTVLRLCELKRSEEHTSELQSQSNLVCRLLLEKKNAKYTPIFYLVYFFF